MQPPSSDIPSTDAGSGPQRHRLYMMIRVEDQPIKLVFLGDMSDDTQQQVVSDIRGPQHLSLRFRILEKTKEGDLTYTILSLACDDTRALDARLKAMYPDVYIVRMDPKDNWRDAVRAIVI